MAKQITPDMSDDDVRALLDEIGFEDQNALKEAMQTASPKQVFMVAMPHGLSKQPDIASKMAGIEGTVLWVIEGDGGGKFAMIFGGGELKVQEGDVEARSTVTLSIDTWKEMSSGQTNPQMAFMQGKMTVTGDMSFLMQLQGVMPQM